MSLRSVSKVVRARPVWRRTVEGRKERAAKVMVSLTGGRSVGSGPISMADEDRVAMSEK